MIGKIPKYKDNESNQVHYYRGTYFIVNFHERKMETFTLPCFESDLEMAFSDPYDRFRITKWLRSIEDFDGFLFGDEDCFEAFISIEKDRKYIESLNEHDYGMEKTLSFQTKENVKPCNR